MSGAGAASFRDILVVVAMDEEEAAVLAELRDRPSTESTFSKFGLRARVFSDARTISVLKTGVGAVNAALGVALFAESHRLDAVVLLGVGGAIRTDLAIGDLVVSKLVLQHDYLFSLDFGTRGFAPVAEPNAEALLVEMEAAGVAQVAEKLGIPFVVAKTVADRLFPDGTIENDFRTCLEAASRNAARVVRAVIHN